MSASPKPLPSAKTEQQEAPAGNLPIARQLPLSAIGTALGAGWRIFRAIPGVSIAVTLPCVLIGFALLSSVGRYGLAPLAIPLAGGFMLLGPALLSGYFCLLQRHQNGQQPRLRDAWAAFIGAPGGLWLLALLCAFLFLIWITDAAVLYAIMIGGDYQPYQLPWLIRLQHNVIAFELWAALMGAVLAFIIFAISAFAVPLLYQRRADAVQAISVSVRAVFKHFLVCISWGLLLTVATASAIVLLPLLLLVLPVLAYASFALYQRVFPDTIKNKELQALKKSPHR